MNRKTKKLLSLFLSLVLAISCLSISFSAFSSDNVEINTANFPDPVFRQIIASEKYDKDRNGYLSADERNSVSVMSITGLAIDGTIKTLKGIEFFADSLNVLRCTYLGLEELDVSALYNLTALTCMSNNNLKSLNVSNNKKLMTLNCSDNELLSSLTLGNLNELSTLHCYADSLENIDVSQLPNLMDFRCDQNRLTSINLSNNTKLESFACQSNHLSSLDLSHTAITNIIPEEIGEQTVSASARMNGVEVFIPFTVDDDTHMTSNTLSNDQGNGFIGTGFVAYNVDAFANGIDYTYSVGLQNAVDMEVHIDVTRDFYQISFYADEAHQQLLGIGFADNTTEAYAPDLPDAPECKTFDCWSGPIVNVDADTSVHIIWKDIHSYSLSDFRNGTATITCSVCANNYTVLFKDCINAKTGDSNYCEYLDVVSDGYINAKDYAKLIKMF